MGVYVHVPFCERVCPYCDFAVVAAPDLSAEREARYVEGLLAELAARAPDFEGRSLASLYLGGGTPSLLTAESVARLVAAVRGAFGEPERSAQAPEITLEVNPSTVERERLPAFAQAGVNRLSVGVQSFDDDTLKRLGRAHRAEEAHATLAAARAARSAGIDAISVDLIFAAPGQGPAQLEADLQQLVDFAPEHVSAYALTVEEGTPFALAERRGQLAMPDEDDAASMMILLRRGLEAAGLPAYEISNYARPGFEAAHNRRYWQRRPVLGLGVSAWSTEVPGDTSPFGVRIHNERDVEPWRTRVMAGEPAPAEAREVLSQEVARGEAAFLALRTTAGLDSAAFEREFGAPPRGFWGSAIDEFCRAGLLREGAGGDLRLSERGVLLADPVFAAFVAPAGP